MPAVQLRSDWDAVRVRTAARETDNADQVRRLLAIAAVYEGKDRAEAAQIGAMDRQPCATGCIGSTSTDRPGWSTARHRVPPAG
jgi:hypothetical protein